MEQDDSSFQDFGSPRYLYASEYTLDAAYEKPQLKNDKFIAVTVDIFFFVVLLSI